MLKVTMDSLIKEYTKVCGELGEVISPYEENALDYAYNKVINGYNESIVKLLEEYRNDCGENGETIELDEEVAVEFVYNKIKELELNESSELFSQQVELTASLTNQK